jgi:hypothetical protein
LHPDCRVQGRGWIRDECSDLLRSRRERLSAESRISAASVLEDRCPPGVLRLGDD